MVEETRTLTVHATNYASKQLTVPADVQREQGICIDDEVEVTIHDVSDIIDQASFTGPQTGGDRMTIPADVSRQLGLEGGEQYEFSFEKVEDNDVPGAISDEEVDSEVVDDALDKAESEPDEESEGLGELFVDDEEDEAEKEDEGLGEVFG